MKGGVGKSTLTVNLAWHLAAYRNWLKNILVVDLDPQFNASQYLVGVTQIRRNDFRRQTNCLGYFWTTHELLQENAELLIPRRPSEK